MQIGAKCYLYKTCKICNKTKHFTGFSKSSRRYRDRRSYCRDCKTRKHERHIPNVSYIYDVSILTKNIIKARERTINGQFRREYHVPLQYAKQLVAEGNAAIVHSTLIHRLYSREQIRELVFKRDRYTCNYCGKYGDTIDHVVPKSKGGMTSSENCVCACRCCNQLKDNMDVSDFFIRFNISNATLNL